MRAYHRLSWGFLSLVVLNALGAPRVMLCFPENSTSRKLHILNCLWGIKYASLWGLIKVMAITRGTKDV